MVTIRRAAEADVSAIVALLADDPIGAGLGEALLRWAIGRARDEGCPLVQLTSDRTRVGAHRFYERLGFAATHEGFKLSL